MNFGYKDNEAALHAYTLALNGLNIGQNFIAKLLLEYSELFIKFFGLFFMANSLNRLDEFLDDFKSFIAQMLRKYRVDTPNGYSLDQPFERKAGTKSKQEKSYALKRLESKYTNEYDADEFSL